MKVIVINYGDGEGDTIWAHRWRESGDWLVFEDESGFLHVDRHRIRSMYITDSKPAEAEGPFTAAVNRLSEAKLGLATTAQLLSELQARAEVGGYGQYRTVDPEQREGEVARG